MLNLILKSKSNVEIRIQSSHYQTCDTGNKYLVYAFTFVPTSCPSLNSVFKICKLHVFFKVLSCSLYFCLI